jgi:hypothetical protein
MWSGWLSGFWGILLRAGYADVPKEGHCEYLGRMAEQFGRGSRVRRPIRQMTADGDGVWKGLGSLRRPSPTKVSHCVAQAESNSALAVNNDRPPTLNNHS